MTHSVVQGAPLASAGRMSLLDGMRFFVAVAVVLYHFTATPTAERYWGADPAVIFSGVNAVSRYGWLGVQLFFVISGLVILRSAEGATLAGFTASRVSRLFPAYWACVVATFALRMVWDHERRPTVWQGVLNLTMVQGQVGVPNLQVVFWTLLVELKFYFLVGVLLAVGPMTRRRALVLAVTWPLTALAVEVAFARHPDGLLGVLLGSSAGLLVPQFAACFGVGMVLHLLRDGLRRPGVWCALAVNLVLLVRVVLSSASEAAELQGVDVDGGVATLVVLGGVVVLASALWLEPPRRVAQLLVWLGALTYPLYLLHVEFGYALIDLLAGAWPPALVLAFACALAVGMAVVLSVAVERRFGPSLRSSATRALGRGVGHRRSGAVGSHQEREFNRSHPPFDAGAT